MSFKKSFILFLQIIIVGSVLSPFAIPKSSEAVTCSEGNRIKLIGVTHDTNGPDGKYINTFKDDGNSGGFEMNTVRIWVSIRNYNSVPDDDSDVIKELRRYKTAGYKVMAVFADKYGSEKGRLPSYEEVKNYFTLFQSRYGKYVDYWEMQNEPNLKQYWKGTINDYLKIFQKGGWDALHPKGEYVVSAAIAGNESIVIDMIENKNLLSMTDAVAFHPYGDVTGQGIMGKVNQQISKITKVYPHLDGHPLFITEWNVHAKELSFSEWAKAFKPLYAGIKGCVTGLWYYHGTADPNTSAGRAGLITLSGQHHEPFYSAVRSVFTGLTLSTGGDDDGGGDDGGGNNGGGNNGGGDNGDNGGDNGGGDNGGGNNGGGNNTHPTPEPTCDIKHLNLCSGIDINNPGGGNNGGGNNVQQPVTSIVSPPEATPAGLVPCNGVAINGGVECNYSTFIKLIQNVLNFLFLMTGFVIIIMILWQGFGFLTSQGNPTKVAQLKKSISKTLLGFVIVISSWLIVNVIATALIDKDSGYVNPLAPNAVDIKK